MSINSKTKAAVDALLTNADTTEFEFKTGLKDVTQELENKQAEIDSIQTAKADLASPTLTGTPAAPTAATGTDTTQIATTAFVQTALGTVDLSTKADLNGNAAQDFSADSFNGTELVLGSFTIYDSGSYLYVKYGSNNIARLDSSGNLIVEGNIGAYVGV